MKVLIVEDEIYTATRLQESLSGLSPSVDSVIAGSRSSGVMALREEEFDYIVCDLRLPPSDKGLDADQSHGLAVHAEARDICPGTPCLFFTGSGTSQAVIDQLSTGSTHDILGTGEQYPMTQLLPKDQFMECVGRIGYFNSQLTTLDSINIHLPFDDVVLDHIEQRALRLLARPLNGTNVEATALGGLSGARALKANVKSDHGNLVGTYFVKIGPRADMEQERRNNDLHVNPLLKMGSYPSLIRVIEAGIGSREALVYQLANEYTESLFSVLARCESAAISVVQTLRGVFAPWEDLKRAEVFSVRALRALRIGDAAFQPHRNALETTENFEEIEQEMLSSCQHGDLHGFNVLCARSGDAVVIDFGNVGPAPSCVDPIVLELSILFHKDSPFQDHQWPTDEQAEAWFDLDEYLLGCPVPDFIKACRGWATEASLSTDLPPVVYAEAVRQLKYQDTNHERALGIARAALRTSG